jgi:hypothetical protein
MPDDARTSSGGKGNVAAGADFDLWPQAFLGISWGLGEAAGRRRGAARPLRAAQPPQRAAAQVFGA